MNSRRMDAKEERKWWKDEDSADGGATVGKGCAGIGGKGYSDVSGIDGEGCKGVGGGIDGKGHKGVGREVDGKTEHCAFNIAGGVAHITVGGNLRLLRKGL